MCVTLFFKKNILLITQLVSRYNLHGRRIYRRNRLGVTTLASLIHTRGPMLTFSQYRFDVQKPLERFRSTSVLTTETLEQVFIHAPLRPLRPYIIGCVIGQADEISVCSPRRAVNGAFFGRNAESSAVSSDPRNGFAVIPNPTEKRQVSSRQPDR